MAKTDKTLRNYELLEHKPCFIGFKKGEHYGCTNCSECVYLTGCRAGYEGHEVSDPYRDKQLFKMVNPNAD